MRGVAIVSPVRTAVGNFGGTIKDISAADLASTAVSYTHLTLPTILLV